MAKIYNKFFNGTINKVFIKPLTEKELNFVWEGKKFNEGKTHKVSLACTDGDGSEFWVNWGNIGVKEGREVSLRVKIGNDWVNINDGAKACFMYAEETNGGNTYRTAKKSTFAMTENGPEPDNRYTYGESAPGVSGDKPVSPGGSKGGFNLKGVKIGHAGTSAAIWFQRFGMPMNEQDFLDFGAFCHDLTKRLEEETRLDGAQVGHSVKNALRVAEDQDSVEKWAKYFLNASKWFSDYIDGKIDITPEEDDLPF